MQELITSLCGFIALESEAQVSTFLQMNALLPTEVPTPLALPLTKGCLCLLLTVDCFRFMLQGSLTLRNYSPLFLPSLPVVQDVFIGHLLFAAYLSLPYLIS